MNKPCATCGGTGQIGYFQGESRFLLTWEECPRCSGTGLGESPAAEGDKGRNAGSKARRKKGAGRKK